ncbi:protein of unknown function [Candidatus Nitrosacidococcus tergens]|uniref:Uncharacterized protein n=1 Tax=Candidatus Nitrosacidococcus tergens TaxID=553981 RepID=A0A7G1Q9M8_9GAMM|nr:protein of unknown function [Candidatus Nitrosacidococcus tergens]
MKGRNRLNYRFSHSKPNNLGGVIDFTLAKLSIRELACNGVVFPAPTASRIW